MPGLSVRRTNVRLNVWEMECIVKSSDFSESDFPIYLHRWLVGDLKFAVISGSSHEAGIPREI